MNIVESSPECAYSLHDVTGAYEPLQQVQSWLFQFSDTQQTALHTCMSLALVRKALFQEALDSLRMHTSTLGCRCVQGLYQLPEPSYATVSCLLSGLLAGKVSLPSRTMHMIFLYILGNAIP